MSTIQNFDTPIAARQSGGGSPRKIGIHITLPPLSLWMVSGAEHSILSRLLSNALNHQSLLIGDLALLPFEQQVFGFVNVSRLGPALTAIVAELDATKLLAVSHLAWLDMDEVTWRTDHPRPEIIPFNHHLDAFEAWMRRPQQPLDVQISDCLAKTSALLAKRIKQLPPPS
jgi:hypothetical protein